jgi:hypothetical protein
MIEAYKSYAVTKMFNLQLSICSRKRYVNGFLKSIGGIMLQYSRERNNNQ